MLFFRPTDVQSIGTETGAVGIDLEQAYYQTRS